MLNPSVSVEGVMSPESTLNFLFTGVESRENWRHTVCDLSKKFLFVLGTNFSDFLKVTNLNCKKLDESEACGKVGLHGLARLNTALFRPCASRSEVQMGTPQSFGIACRPILMPTPDV